MKRSDASAREETGDFVPQTDECEVKRECKPNGGAQYEKWLLDADCVGARVRKMFDGKYYGGTVTAYDEQHKWYKIEYDDGDGEELNPKELWYVLTFAPKDAEDDSGLAPEFIDLTSEDDEPDRTPEDETPSDTADVATRCPPRFRKRSCVNFRAPIADDREEPDGIPVEGLAHIYEQPDGRLRVLFPGDKLRDEAVRGDGVGYLRLGILETVGDAVKLYNCAAQAQGATEQELPKEHLDPSNIKEYEWIHKELRGNDKTGIRITRTGTFCVRVVKRGETKPTTLSLLDDIAAAVEAYNGKQSALYYYGQHKLELTPSARDAADRMRTDRLAARGEAPLPTPTKTRKRTAEIKRDVCGIKGLHVFYEAFTEDVERRMFHNEDLFRFGAPAPDASNKSLDSTLGMKNMPDDIMRVANLVRDSGLDPTLITPDHVMSQSYPPTAGFMAHIDDNSRWGEAVVGVSLGADGVLYFTPNCKNERAIGARICKAALENDFKDYPTKSGITESDSWRTGRGSRVNKGAKSWALELEIPRRSIYVMTGAARTDLEHGIRGVRAPSDAPSWNPTGVRRSLTLRAQKPYSDATLEHLAKKNPLDVSIDARLSAQRGFKTASEATTYGNTGGAEQARAFVADNPKTHLRFDPSQVGSVSKLIFDDEEEDDDDESNEGYEPPPPKTPTTVDDKRKRKRTSEREWAVDEIVGKRVLDDGDTEYKVKWSGTDSKGRRWKPSWEPESNLASCQDAVDDYERVMKRVMKRSEGGC